MIRTRSRIPAWGWGVIGLVFLAACSYVIFGGRAGLGTKHFELKMVFRSDAQLTQGSPVRIAGIDVGKVTAIKPLGQDGGASLVTAEIDPVGLPIHADATAKIRSRLLLEGNYYIELRPGTPSAPAMHAGATIGAVRTAGPVQFDRLLTDLQSDTRISLRTVLQGFGSAYGTPGRPQADDDPSTRGLTGGQALNKTLQDAPEALLGLAQTNQAFLGVSPGDLAQLVRDQARVSSAFASREQELSELIVGLNTTMLAFASRQSSLRSALAILPGVLGKAIPTLDALDASLPALRRFARELTPSTRELPSTIDVALPWIEQAKALVSRPELGRLATLARPATADSARGLAATRTLLNQFNGFNTCILHDLEPIGRLVVKDPPLTTGVPVFREFLQTFVGVLSSTQNFDGNGVYARAQAGGGDDPVATSALKDQGPLRGNTTRAPLGTRPAYPRKEPPLRYDVACSASKRPDVNGARTGAGP